MSEDKRKNARTQGRFSGEKEFQLSRQDKQKDQKTPRPDNKNKGEKSYQSGAKTARVNVQYHDDSTYSFKELEQKQKPKELKFRGVETISESENGKSSLIYEPNFFCKEEADELMTILENSTTWYDKNIIIHGQEYPQPRLVAWYGPLPYTYSGATLDAKEMPAIVQIIKDKVEGILKEYNIDVVLNSVLLNLYRNEKDSVAWHSDDEFSMGICPTIASVSLGAVRKFEMRPKSHICEQIKDLDADTVIYVNLTPGSLIVMDGCMQKDWQHRVPKEYHDKAPRINLTFRTVYPIDQLPPELSPRRTYKSFDNMPVAKAVQQPEHKFDSKSFPPLETTINKKHQKSKKVDVTNGSPSSSSTSSLDEKILDAVTSTEYAENSNKNQNNLNKEIDCCSSLESSQAYYDEQNFNLTEPEKSSGSKFSPSDELMDDISSELDLSQTYSNVNCIPTEGFQVKDIQHAKVNISENNVAEPKIDSELPIAKGSKSLLNANAPDFIPHAMNSNQICPGKNLFHDYSLMDLAKYGPQIKKEEISDFIGTIYEQLRTINLMVTRDWFELDTYDKLCKDDTLSEENLRVIINRICSMILNAYKWSKDTRSPYGYSAQRSINIGNYPRQKKTYKPVTGHRY
ncbi:alpha-ketoglutarate-dependent dioxygenase alkB homolog 3 [Nephila pilipes]|uniref:Alpha-ketoglutarate-dependent dioxygenase alkB homolog 3 n=1 Tax=Nephila pilipes TaxID=299642 RepID=A0A8X6N2H0_NEPPI|nr:alpha-ketoglutarate-dependent dioxygenase alkB homolog 3 [Nephila pilipes]